MSKTAGCDYMACRCGNSFCYKCGEKTKAHFHPCDKEKLKEIKKEEAKAKRELKKTVVKEDTKKEEELIK